ncbi:hypothetical protein F2Q69_00054216 [Brassica cretica]|uniref:Uncharacterized protein n=1 Tax=Brassica cretica TaxID=69181 RepID=A0A8S9MWL1_BRACR|nr:hypothetical protein F2Q69_00054216 [Brassica cretica]
MNMFTKISFYRGEVQITNAFDASIIYLDPTMEHALQFKEKLMEDELPLAVIEKKNGEVQITNAFDASIIYLDPTMEHALQFKEKLMEDELSLAVIEKKNGKRERSFTRR